MTTTETTATTPPTDKEKETVTGIKCGLWAHLHIDGLAPRARSGHSIVQHNGALFCFGGFDGTAQHFSELSMLVMTGPDRASWAPVATAGAYVMQGRTLHTAVMHSGAMWVFGGSGTRPAAPRRFGLFGDSGGARDATTHGSIVRFDFATREWSDVAATGIAPAARDGHSAVVSAASNCMIIFGGSDDSTLFSDTFAFDFGARLWAPMRTRGSIPTARRLHSAIVYEPSDAPGRQSMLVFGGYNGSTSFADCYSMEIATATWTPIVTKGDPPSPRFGHTAVVHGRWMYIFGGYGAGLGFRRDMWRLSLDTWAWQRVVCAGEEIVARRCHAAGVLTSPDGSGDSLIVFGGATSTATAKILADTLQFRFSDDPEDGIISPDGAATSASVRPVKSGELGADLLKLVGDPTFSDVTLVLAGGSAKVRAHRAILAARSPVFDRLFRSGMRDSHAGGEVIIEEAGTPEAFEALLRFLYSGSPVEGDADPALVAELLSLAERYIVPPLKAWCESYLSRSLDASNAVRMLIEADKFSCARLKRATVAFVSSHYSDVSKDPDFPKLPQHLLLEIIAELSKR